MKKIILAMVLLLLWLPAIHAVVQSPLVKVTLISQNPDPVEPGQVVTLKFKVENLGSESTDEALVKILPTYPFQLYQNSAQKNIGRLRAGSGADSHIVEFKLKIDEKAVERETSIALAVYLGDTATTYNNNEFVVHIFSKNPILEISSVSTQPSQVPPGGSSDITLTLKNVGQGLLKNIQTKFDFSSATLPLAPGQSSGRSLAGLESQFQNSLVFTVIAKPDASAGLYKIPLNITYLDEKGNSYTINDFVAVTIGESPRLQA